MTMKPNIGVTPIPRLRNQRIDKLMVQITLVNVDRKCQYFIDNVD